MHAVPCHQADAGPPARSPLFRRRRPAIDRDLSARNLCALGLLFGWAMAVAALTTGIMVIVSSPTKAPDFLLDRIVEVGVVSFSWLRDTGGLPADVNTYLRDHRVFLAADPASTLVSLALQVALTLILRTVGAVHAATLRWQLFREGRLRTTNSLRLFTNTLSWGPNSWPANAVSCLGFVLAYGGATISTFPMHIVSTFEIGDDGLPILSDDVPGERDGVDFSGWGLVGLGSGLVLQLAVSTWSLFAGAACVETWNASPLETAHACKVLSGESSHGTTPAARRAASDHVISIRPYLPSSSGSTVTPASSAPSFVAFHRPRRSSNTLSSPLSKSRSHLESLLVTTPEPSQPSARELLPDTRHLTRIVWALTAFFLAAAITVLGLSLRLRTASLAFTEKYYNFISLQTLWLSLGRLTFRFGGSAYVDPRGYLALVLQSAALTLPLLVLHCVSQLAQLARDEEVWRQCTTREGARMGSGQWLDTLRSPINWGLFAAEVAVPWVFGYAFSCNVASVYVHLLPLWTQVVLFAVLACWCQWGLVGRRQKGTQPAAYGDVTLLMELVDEWGDEDGDDGHAEEGDGGGWDDKKRTGRAGKVHGRLFWGDKGEYITGGGVRIAGTAGTRLADLRMDGTLYVGLARQASSAL